MAMEIKLWNGWYHTWLVIITLAAKHVVAACILLFLQVRGQKYFYGPHPQKLFCDLGPTEVITALRCSGTPQSKPLK